MKTVRVVAHCWNYSRLLSYHLSALVLHRPQESHVVMTVCYSPCDKQTVDMLDFFADFKIPNVTWDWYPMEKNRLCRRAIGRNELARMGGTDFTFYADVDYILRGDVIDAAVQEIGDRHALFYPRDVLQSKTHQDGDAEIERVTEPGLYELESSRYDIIKLDRPIGGAQWLRSDFLREKGYLPDGHKFLNPEPSWKRTYEDARCRGYWGLPWKPLDVQGVYRIRHSERGRETKGLSL